jgi:hypothetical protein
VAVVAALSTLHPAGAPTTLARFGDIAGTGAFLGAGTLDPPTALAASGASTVTLSWTPTVDAGATGYRVYRSTTAGSGHVLVGADVTPRSASSTTDSPPAAGTYHYVLRSFLGSWLSIASNEASATVVVVPVTTPWAGCAAATSAAEAAWGDGDGYGTTPGDACGDGGGVATDAATGRTGHDASCTNQANDAHRFRDFSLAVPALAAVLGIEVRADLGMNNNGGTSVVCAQLSWDAGTTWTAAKSVALGGTAETTYVLGGAGDTWGRAWTPAELANASFRVRLIDATTQNNKNYLLDFVAVRVTYRL